ncbi:hypothetical protein MMC22_001171 [Lobaria immixta]|nr:hypothetical protein [Lobaria immixta]
MASKKFGVTFLSLPDNLFPDRTLPREGSSDFPRLIDEAGEFRKRVDSAAGMELNDLRLPDLIVTVLNNYDEKCGFIKRLIYGNETSMHGTLVFEYTIQQSGRWRPEYCGFAAVSRPYYHSEDMQRKGMNLAIQGLYFKWWQDTKFVKIEVIGLDANDTAAANLQNVSTEPDVVNPFTTTPTASDLNFKPKA